MVNRKLSEIEYYYYKNKIEDTLDAVCQMLRTTYKMTLKNDMDKIAIILLKNNSVTQFPFVDSSKLTRHTNDAFEKYYSDFLKKYEYKEGKIFGLRNATHAKELLREHDKYVKDKNEYYLSMFDLMDKAGTLRFTHIMFEDAYYNKYAKVLSNRATKENVEEVTKRLVEYRNKKAHEDNTTDNFSFDILANFVKDVSLMLDMFKPDICQQEQKVVREYIKELKTDIQKRPIKFEQLRQINPNLTDNYLRNSIFRDHIDFDKGIVYLHTIDEIQRSYQIIIGLQSVIPTNAISGSSNINLQIINEVKPLRSLYDMSMMVSTSILNEKQVNDVFEESVVFVDTSLLLNEQSRDIFVDLAKSYFPKRNIIPNVTYQTRAELFTIENDKNRDQKTRDNAKYARTSLHLLHEHGLVYYASSMANVKNASEDFVYNYALKNKERRFIVLEDFGTTIGQKYIEYFKTELKRNSVNNMEILSCWYSLRAKTMKYKFIEESIDTFQKYISMGDIEDPFAEANDIEQSVTKEVKTDIEVKTEETSDDPIEKTQPVAKTILRIVYRENGDPLQLVEEIAKGGEGTLYAMGKKSVVKIYHDDKLSNDNVRQQKEKKLKELMQLNFPCFCMPVHLVYDANKNGKFIGYEMKRLNDTYVTLRSSVLLLNGDTVRNSKMSKWQRKHLVDVCLKLCKTIKMAHDNDVIIGDLNENNIMIKYTDINNIDLCFVDCDSLQYREYPCPVGRVEYTNPEIYEREHTDNPSYDSFLRTKEDDMYALACMMFRILMLSTSPFDSKNNDMELKERMKAYIFPFKNDYNDSSGKEVPDGLGQLIWGHTPLSVRRLFAQEFTHQRHVTIDEWIDALDHYYKCFKNKKYTNEIAPIKYYDNEQHEYTTDFKCESCGRETNLPKMQYEARMKKGELLLCPICRQSLESLRKEYITEERDEMFDHRKVTCSKCGKTFQVDNYYDAYMFKNAKRYRLYCNDCKNKEVPRRKK